jgi:hypothetical protein
MSISGIFCLVVEGEWINPVNPSSDNNLVCGRSAMEEKDLGSPHYIPSIGM